MNFWDQRYSVEGYKYGVAPNIFLAEQAKALPVNAQVLVPGDGEGRNGVWLAKQGHRVLSIDSSSVGLEKAQALAGREGVSLTLAWPICRNGGRHWRARMPWC